MEEEKLSFEHFYLLDHLGPTVSIMLRLDKWSHGVLFLALICHGGALLVLPWTIDMEAHTAILCCHNMLIKSTLFCILREGNLKRAKINFKDLL